MKRTTIVTMLCSLALCFALSASAEDNRIIVPGELTVKGRVLETAGLKIVKIVDEDNGKVCIIATSGADQSAISTTCYEKKK